MDLPNRAGAVPRTTRAGRLDRVMRTDNTRQAQVLRACRTALLLMVLGLSTAYGEEKPLIEAPVVDWSVARSIYQQADKWIKDDKVARDPADRPVLVSGVVGVRVTLRFGGLTLAMGDAMSDAAKLESAVDLRELVARAADVALVKYHEARDRTVRPAAADPDEKNDKAVKGDAVKVKAVPRPVRAGAIPLDLDLQIAHSPTDVLLPASAGPQAIYYQFAAGYHALRLTSTAKTPLTAMIWPGNAVASNLLPASQITQLLADTGHGPQDILNMPAKIAREGGPRFQRLEVIHLVRPFDGQPVAQLIRGNEVIPSDAVDMGTLDSMGRRLATHLANRTIMEGKSPGTLAGTYHPTSDRYDPDEASPADTALAGYAIAQRAAMIGKSDPNGLEFLNTKEKGRVLIDQLRKELVGLKPAEGDPQAKALLLLTLVDTPYLAEHKADRDKLGAALIALPTNKGWFVNPATRAGVDAEGQAILVAALVSLYERTRDDGVAAVIEPAMDALWASKLETLDVVSAMPWMSMAAARLHRVNLAQLTDANAKAAEAVRWKARVAAMRSLGESLREKKLIRTSPALGPADVVGGYDLINDTTEGAPTPDWRSAQVLAFLASIGAEKDIMEGEKPARFTYDAMLTIRFLAQLMMDEPSAYYVRGARRDAIDGVRLALWDNRLPVKPTAMTLLAVTQFKQTLEAMEKN
jgi:hypothetical protein